ncbi:DUF5666 domain-containing protein [Streptomyces sp. S.PB5]|uniref:DUF5666 domain-containing protein n=1 Tax=Streptomyces sp. S.PB5 TaxID=3020844 RepID=UPI0025B0A4A9|nr:DUF5666 domain-containing protein [Streptomyces sp. S.PB5]MDN3024208.1 DUF5666 domain-containing protein [Streptomyces sp. S.PB5]
MTHEPDHEATPPETLVGPGEDTPLRDRWRRRPVHTRAVTAAALVAALALGGAAVAYAATSSGSDGGATPSASGSASPSPGERGERHGHGWWFGPGGDAVHGETTVKDRDTGEWVVRVWQRGTVEKVDGDQVTVKSEDGAEWTWTVEADTPVVRDDGKGSGADDLKQGETVHLSGTRSGDDTRTADRVFAGTWEKPDPGKWREKLPELGEWLDRLPGHDHHEPPAPAPSGSGATT